MLGILILAVFLAVLLLSLLFFSALRQGLRAYEQRYLEHGTRRLSEMFIFIDRRQLLLLTLSLTLAAGLLGYVLFHWFIALVLAAAALLAPFFVIQKLRERRVHIFDRQLGDALVQLSAALRAGLTLAQGAESVAQESSAPLGDEFKVLVRELKLGVSQDEALNNLAQRVGSESLHLTVTASNVARQLGANLAEMYDVISATIRERFQVESRVRALTAMGRMQAWVVGVMPLGMGVAFYFMRPDLMEPMLDSLFGWTLIIAIVLMELAGLWLIRRIVDIEY